MTRSILRKCLPLAGDVRVHQWRSDKVAFATSIGVAGAWLADVGFDQLDPLRAQLHVFTVRVSLLVKREINVHATQFYANSVRKIRLAR